ncbi:MAG: hypothetical protein J6S91_05100 [Treponema sp.]|nr:hypothetical protein [Treponema sp.]
MKQVEIRLERHVYACNEKIRILEVYEQSYIHQKSRHKDRSGAVLPQQQIKHIVAHHAENDEQHIFWIGVTVKPEGHEKEEDLRSGVLTELVQQEIPRQAQG